MSAGDKKVVNYSAQHAALITLVQIITIHGATCVLGILRYATFLLKYIYHMKKDEQKQMQKR